MCLRFYAHKLIVPIFGFLCMQLATCFLSFRSKWPKKAPGCAKLAVSKVRGGESVWRRGCTCSEILKDLMKTEPFKIVLNTISLTETQLCPQHTTILLERKLTIFFLKKNIVSVDT